MLSLTQSLIWQASKARNTYYCLSLLVSLLSFFRTSAAMKQHKTHSSSFLFFLVIYVRLLRHNLMFNSWRMCHINKSINHIIYFYFICLIHKSYIFAQSQNICSNLYSSPLMRLSINYDVERMAANVHSVQALKKMKALERSQRQIQFRFFSLFISSRTASLHCSYFFPIMKFFTEFFTFPRSFIRESASSANKKRTCVL